MKDGSNSQRRSKMKIDSFSGEHEFLSNFMHSEIEYEGGTYPTVEHAFQAAKTLDKEERKGVREKKTPGQAKRAGRKVKLRPHWDNMKCMVMHNLLVKKFENEYLREKLLATGDAELIEGNTWGDKFWGVCKGEGENNLGRILMKVREKLRNEGE